MASDTLPTNGRDKVALRQGFHMADWLRLTNSAKDLSGAKRNGGMRGYTLEEVRQHRSEHDAWAVFFGKVYNITPYLHYHPGGMDILLKTAGRDCTSLFQKYHPWVNIDGLAGKLVVGVLVDEEGKPVDFVGGEKTPSGGAALQRRGAPSTSRTGGGDKTFPTMEPPKPKVPINIPGLLSQDSFSDDHEGSKEEGGEGGAAAKGEKEEKEVKK